MGLIANRSRERGPGTRKKQRLGGGYWDMGLLTILKKMKQKERELRLLMLYPPRRRSREGSGMLGGLPPGGRFQAPPAGSGMCGRLARTNCPFCVTHVGPTIAFGRGPGGGRTTGSGRGGGLLPKAKGMGVKAQRPGLMSQCRGR